MGSWADGVLHGQELHSFVIRRSMKEQMPEPSQKNAKIISSNLSEKENTAGSRSVNLAELPEGEFCEK